MFTGIIEQLGEVKKNFKQNQSNLLFLHSNFAELTVGESIAVDGVCLTLLSQDQDNLSFDVSSETLSKTNLGLLKAGDQVNLERAMQAQARFGGHYVSGHVDTTAQVLKAEQESEFVKLSLTGFKPEHMKFLLPKGSITVNGVSLTINAVESGSLQLMLIPHTLSITNLKTLKAEQTVNIEFDYLTRIVAHQLHLLGQSTNEVNP